MALMHKNFYASGFLYHSRSQQILLQQKNSEQWTLLSGNGLQNESWEETFKRVVENCVHIKPSLSSIKQIYTYFNHDLKKEHFVSYVTVQKLTKFSATKDTSFAWFTFKQVTKLNLSSQTKQDITVGKRVIDSFLRKSLGQQTIG